MKPVTRYQSEDGSVWDSEPDALRRDDLCRAVADAMAPLGEAVPIPSDRYREHTPETVRLARVGLVGITRRLLPTWCGEQARLRGSRTDDIPPSWLCRACEDSGNSPLARAWVRLMCIDGSCREWQQPYYAEHPPADAEPLD